jgi:hypothetical protein
MKTFKFVFSLLAIGSAALIFSAASLSAQTVNDKSAIVSSTNGEPIVILVSTPNMKPVSETGDYDRVKAILKQEYGNQVRYFSPEKMAFMVFTGTGDEQKVAQIRYNIKKMIPDAVITTLTESAATSTK